jgi:Asp-tRNA(Asn)/Glu-tRNA(Gln) amidotransferase C subunit
MVHVEFQRELNASLLAELADLRGYVNQVQSLQKDIREMEVNTRVVFYNDRHRWFHRKMQELAKLEPPARRQPDAARYHEEETSP